LKKNGSLVGPFLKEFPKCTLPPDFIKMKMGLGKNRLFKKSVYFGDLK
jgi:hypothetical protein